MAEQLLHWRDWKANASPPGMAIVTARERIINTFMTITIDKHLPGHVSGRCMWANHC